MLAFLALVMDTAPAEADQLLSRMTAVYERVCLQAFPDDKAVEALMRRQKARELTKAEAKLTLGDDPGRVWQLRDGSAAVWLAFPPFHACSVRWTSPQMGDLAPYRAAVRKYEEAVGGFRPMPPLDSDRGDYHIYVVGEWRFLPNSTSESLSLFEQHLSDPKRAAAGETGVVLRLVHQFAPPPVVIF
jgi:hypothetical protein